MPSVQIVDQTGKVRETLELNAAVFGAAVNMAVVHQAVVRAQAGARAGTHDTKGRSEVSGGGRKPWRQKGTGRARQGTIRATQWKGGGKPFGPTPRSHAQGMPREMRRVALRAALSDKLASGHVTVVDELRVPEPKTKALVALLAGLGVGPGRTLVVVAELGDAVARASRNVPWLSVVRPGQLSVVELLRNERVLFDRGALIAVQETLAS